MSYVIESDPAYPGMWMIANPDADEQIEYYEVVRQIPTLQEAEEILCFLRSGATVRDYDEARKRGVQ